jgi:hypothetical protein
MGQRTDEQHHDSDEEISHFSHLLLASGPLPRVEQPACHSRPATDAQPQHADFVVILRIEGKTESGRGDTLPYRILYTGFSGFYLFLFIG